MKQYGYRMKFPAKSVDLSRRWCSAYLKIAVADSVISNLDRLDQLGELGGRRLKFPAKGGTHQGRWCSGNLKASGWKCVGEAGGKRWTGIRRPEVDLYPAQMKLRFEIKGGS